MSDLSVSEASEVTLLQELLSRKTEYGHHLFKEASITNKEGKVQLLGIMANVEMTLTPKPKEEGEKEEE